MEALVGFLPYALLFLLCPLMMVFMHRGRAHDGHADRAQHAVDDRADLARRLEASKTEVKT